MERSISREEIQKKAAPRLGEFERALKEYKNGELSENRFRAIFQSLRSTVNARMKNMKESGMESEILDETIAYNIMSANSDYFSAFINTPDKTEAYERMMEFYKSGFSTKRTYRESINYVKESFEMAGINIPEGEIDVNNNLSELDKLIASGTLSSIMSQYGDSGDTYEDMEQLLNEGVTAEEIEEAFADYIAGSKDGAYDLSLAKARESMRRRTLGLIGEIKESEIT